MGANDKPCYHTDVKYDYCHAQEAIQDKLTRIADQLGRLETLKVDTRKQLERALKINAADIAEECRDDLALFDRLTSECDQLYSELQEMLSSWHDETTKILAGRIEAEA